MDSQEAAMATVAEDRCMVSRGIAVASQIDVTARLQSVMTWRLPT
jgi:hypothetical protein